MSKKNTKKSKSKINIKFNIKKYFTDDSYRRIVFIAIGVLILVILILILSKFQVLKIGKSDENQKFETVYEYVVNFDEEGNEIRTDPVTKETTIITKNQMPTLSSEEQMLYDEESKKRQEQYDLLMSGYDEKLEAGDLSEEKYDELVKEAIKENIVPEDTYKMFHGYELKVSKEIFNNCDQERFMSIMSQLYTDYNALVNIENKSLIDETAKDLVFLIEGYNEKDLTNIRDRFAEALGSEQFSFAYVDKKLD